MTQWPIVSHLLQQGTDSEAIHSYHLTLPTFFNVRCYPSGENSSDDVDQLRLALTDAKKKVTRQKILDDILQRHLGCNNAADA